MLNKKQKHLAKIIIVALVAAAMAFSALTPLFAAESIKAEIEEIRDNVEALQRKAARAKIIERITADRVPEGFSFNTNFRERARGEGVRYLQIVLNLDPDTRVAHSGPGSPGNETSYFGPATRRAVIRFQEKYAGEVLRPSGISHGTGFVGERTRSKLNEILRQGIEIERQDRAKLTEIKQEAIGIIGQLELLKERIEEMEDREELVVSMETNKEVYSQGEEIEITIVAENHSSLPKTINFNTGCQTYYSIGDFTNRDRVCTMALTYVVLPAEGDHIWEWIHDLNEYPLAFGEYTIEGSLFAGRDHPEITKTTEIEIRE